MLLFRYQISYTVAYLVGIGLSYWLNLKFVFKEKSSKKKMILFPFVYFVQYVFGMFIMHVAIEMFDFPERLVPILVVILTIPLTFILAKTIFTRKI